VSELASEAAEESATEAAEESATGSTTGPGMESATGSATGSAARPGARDRTQAFDTTTPPGIAFRPATPDDLAACAAIWRDSINDYLAPRNIPLVPDELGPIGRLYRHLQSTDPTRFVVATRSSGDGPSSERIVGFTAAVVRERLWFLSMLFVMPGEQARGLGRMLVERVLPADRSTLALATATDSMQPISNALYASMGIVPRMPLVSIVGRPARTAVLPTLPEGLRVEAMDAMDAMDATDDVDRLDTAVLGIRHPQDHAYLRTEGRQGYLYRTGSGEVVGYGYTSMVGRVGPVAVADADLLWPVMAHLLGALEPRGASAVWAPGAAGPLVTGLIRAGMRLEDYPVLVCWSQPFADFSRYVPISPGLL
jgi:GNAT superfamily N-acetyltransferase